MTTPMRFAYAHPDAHRAEGNLLAYLPITLRYDTYVLTVMGFWIRVQQSRCSHTLLASSWAWCGNNRRPVCTRRGVWRDCQRGV
jgi:hypothetical protein